MKAVTTKPKIGISRILSPLFFGLVLAFVSSILAAYFGARSVGVEHGGWEWQFMLAYFGGAAYGIMGFGIAFPMLARSHRSLTQSFWIAIGGVTVTSFLLSVVIYGIGSK